MFIKSNLMQLLTNAYIQCCNIKTPPNFFEILQIHTQTRAAHLIWYSFLSCESYAYFIFSLLCYFWYRVILVYVIMGSDYKYQVTYNIDGLVQDCSMSNALAMEIL